MTIATRSRASIVKALEARGARAGYPPVGFPMEADDWPGKMWVISHKPVAVAAGLGRMGIHRNVIHPKFGNFILLGTVAIDLDIAHSSAPLDFNPCLECKLCVAACPTGAIAPDGHFDFAACYTHNYREFMGGFSDFVETIADSERRARLSRRSSTTPKPSPCGRAWPSAQITRRPIALPSVPAGEDVIGAYATTRRVSCEPSSIRCKKKAETIYVTHGLGRRGLCRAPLSA